MSLGMRLIHCIWCIYSSNNLWRAWKWGYFCRQVNHSNKLWLCVCISRWSLTLLKYRIAENFHGRKLSQISWFCGYENFLWKFSLKFEGLASFGDTSEQSTKVFSAKIFFPSICECFLPQKFPIRCYCFCLNATYLILHLNHLHSFFSVQVHHYHSACITLLFFPSSFSIICILLPLYLQT